MHTGSARIQFNAKCRPKTAVEAATITCSSTNTTAVVWLNGHNCILHVVLLPALVTVISFITPTIIAE